MIPLQAQLLASKEEIVDYVNVSWELLSSFGSAVLGRRL